MFDFDYSFDLFPELREFQKKTHIALRDGFANGHKKQLVCSPTGSGKTILALHVARQSLIKKKKVTFLCDRTTLINQTSEVSQSLGMLHGVIQAKHHLRNNSFPYQIASVQTIAKRGWHDTDLLIVDEAHTLHKTWTEFLQNFNGAVIGLTATPFTKGLGKLFSNLVNCTTMHELTESGVLVPMRVISATKINMSGAKTNSFGEWSEKEVETRGHEIIGSVVSEWVNYALDRKTICFGATIAHCKDLCSQFISAGIMAATFTAETTADEREEILRSFKNGDISVLISVEALAKGFDVKEVSCVIDCRPLRKSLATFIQMIGRGARSSPATDKKDFILLDHSGNIIRFLDDFTDFYFSGVESLDDGEKLEKKAREEKEDYEPKPCPKCGYKPFGKKCMGCGHEIEKVLIIEHVAGEMKEIRITGNVAAKDNLHLFEQLVSYNRGKGDPSKIMGRVFHQYKSITGKGLPPAFWNMTPPTVPVSDVVIGKIKSLNIAFQYARKKK